MKDKTEELLPKNPEDKKFSKKTTWLIVGILTLIVVLGIGIYYWYITYKENQFIQNLDLGQKYLDDGDYENAVIAFNEAISLTDNKQNLESANKGLSKAASFDNNIEEAQKAYQNLYDLTEDTYYLNQKDVVNYGNSDSNILNRANTASRAGITYYLQENGDETEIWKIENQNSEKLQELDNTDSTNEPAVKNLNAWGDKLYAIYNEDIITINMTDGKYKTVIETNDVIKDFDITTNKTSEISYFQIYNDKLYFLINKDDEESGGSILVSNPDGSEMKLINKSISGQDKYIQSFFIKENNMYIFFTDQYGGKSLVSKVNLEDGKSLDLFKGSSLQRVMTAAINNNRLYFNVLFIPESAGSSVEFEDYVYYADIDTGFSDVLFNSTEVSAVNTINDKLYFVSDNKFYSSDLTGQNKTEIGEAPEVENSRYNYDSRHIITISNNSVFVTTSATNEAFDVYGFKAETSLVSINDNNVYQSITNIIDTKSDDTDDAEEEETEETEEVTANDSWKQAYIDYLNSGEFNNWNSEYGNKAEFNLININDDDIPELYINGGTTASGDKLITYSEENGLDTLDLWNYGLKYLIRENKLIDFSGHMDYYDNNIYKIQNGQFVTVSTAHYGFPSGFNSSNVEEFVEIDGHSYTPSYEYIWNNKEVPLEEYARLLKENFNESRAKTAGDLNNVSKSEVISNIKSGNY